MSRHSIEYLTLFDVSRNEKFVATSTWNLIGNSLKKTNISFFVSFLAWFLGESKVLQNSSLVWFLCLMAYQPLEVI